MPQVDAVELLLQMVEIPSVNPTLNSSGGEAALVGHLAGVLDGLGFEVELAEVAPGRHNVLGWLRGAPGRTIVLESHVDTVPESHGGQPCALRDGRVWGRGACDTKASGAAMIAALARLAETHQPMEHPSVVFAGIIDEESHMNGAAALAQQISEPTMVIVGEPTMLIPIRAHNGILRFDVEVFGQTAHSSIRGGGINAISEASKLVNMFDAALSKLLSESVHAQTGLGAFTITHFNAGVATNVVPDHVELRFDRRLVPGETIEQVLQGFDQFLDSVSASGIKCRRGEPTLEFAPIEIDEMHPLVRAAEESYAQVLGKHVAASGITFCTDASVLTRNPMVECIVLGPGSIEQAHAPIEWVSVDQVVAAVDIYVSIVERVRHAS